jgi:hypothetical protein
VQGDDVDDGQGGDGDVAVHDVPLVRTEGKTYTNGAVWSVDRLLRDPRLLREDRDPTARAAETAFGLGASLYFYVGHACPDFAASANAWVFVFAADTFDGMPGTMTHFDTGGLHCGKIHLVRDVDLAEYVAAHRLPSLDGWRDRFRAYVGEYFSSTKAYVLGKERAKKDDEHGRLHHPENSDPRAWTWEMQLHDDHDVRVGLLRLWLLYDDRMRLKQLIRRLPADEQQKWREALQGDRLRTPPAVPSESNETAICRLAVEEIASWM